jgi:transposase
MGKTREILRLKWDLGRSHREVAQSLGVSVGVVGSTVRRAQAQGINWGAVLALTDDDLERRLYVPRLVAGAQRPLPDCAVLDLERRKPGVTLALLHLEYLEQHPDGYRYTQFCEIYRRWLKRRRLTMRQTHRAGEKLFVDYAGQKPHLVDPKNGECIAVELFVAALGASNFTYAEATLTQRGPDWIQSHVRTFGELGGVPWAVVPDQLKTGVTTPCRYEPGVQRTYQELAEHYGTVILPARPAKPRDKAKVEAAAVQVAERWILARLRHETFFSLDTLIGSRRRPGRTGVHAPPCHWRSAVCQISTSPTMARGGGGLCYSCPIAPRHRSRYASFAFAACRFDLQRRAEATGSSVAAHARGPEQWDNYSIIAGELEH